MADHQAGCRGGDSAWPRCFLRPIRLAHGRVRGITRGEIAEPTKDGPADRTGRARLMVLASGQEMPGAPFEVSVRVFLSCRAEHKAGRALFLMRHALFVFRRAALMVRLTSLVMRRAALLMRAK